MIITINIQADEKDLGKIAAAFSVLNGDSVSIAQDASPEQPKEDQPAGKNARAATRGRLLEKAIDKVLEEADTKEIPKEEDTTTVEPNVEPVVTPPAVETGKKYTVEEVRAKLTKEAKAGKQKEVVAILNKFGAKSLLDVKEKDFAGVMAEAEKL